MPVRLWPRPRRTGTPKTPASRKMVPAPSNAGSPHRRDGFPQGGFPSRPVGELYQSARLGPARFSSRSEFSERLMSVLRLELVLRGERGIPSVQAGCGNKLFLIRNPLAPQPLRPEPQAGDAVPPRASGPGAIRAR